LVTIHSGDDKTAIGGARYCAVEAHPSARPAELAITVEIGYQGQGMDNLLMRQAIGIARNNDLTHLTADELASLAVAPF
jgi:hypothetical protein